MLPHQLSDEQLLTASRVEPDAFAIFYRRHAEAVLAYLLYRTRDPERALDLTAETFALAFEGCHRYKPSRGPARGWVFGIAKHALADSTRKNAKATSARERLGMERLTFADAELERVEALIDLERTELPYSQLLEDLPEQQPSAVLARVVDEREYDDISEEQQVSEHTIRQRVSRALTRLREHRQHA